MAQSSPQGKKKGKRFAPLPTLAAAEGQLPWRLAFSAKLGRHAVADRDLPAGTLILTEKPLVAIPRSKAAGSVCHACFAELPDSLKKKGKEGFNPCLPRYCAACKASGGGAGPAAAQSRARALCGLAAAFVEHELLHLLVLLDVRRSGAAEAPVGVPLAPPQPDGAPPLLRCTAADADALPPPWHHKPEPWRKAVTAALRPLHRALAALEAAAALPGYRAASLAQLQSDAAMLICNLQGVGAEHAGQDSGVGLFPAAASLNHSCRANCHSVTMGQTMHVRTVVDVVAGQQLTLCHAPQYEPRPVRQAALLQARVAERGLACACERCIEPLATSTDRFLEGVWCLACTVDVLVAVPPGTPEAAAAAARYEEQLAAWDAEDAAAARKSRKGGKKAAAEEQQQQGQEAAPEAANGSAAAEEEADGKEGQQEGLEGEQAEAEPAYLCVPAFLPADPPLPARLPARLPTCLPAANGPGDVMLQADKLWQQGAMLYQVKMAQLMPQAEEFLRQLQQGVEGRLHPYHSRIIDSLSPLISLALRRGDALAVFNYSALLWEAQHAVQARYSLSQLQYLNAIIDTSAAKAAHAQSAVVKRQFEKKLKAAQTTAAEIRRVLLGKS
ncbi:hypothetical protein CHLNCDRAFT_139012 [Chlorella variabilis]|uniref:SET domain-containing protein n=1 Tax=Chlorella variabilis TaxID=554065 RepID=E1ZPL6_CHLVA|nr:hypothetical protein CHLNCDRAFT_139012 [Chlorella variabilis]EFN52201.1 hypothetical protein CHLNCDRAFT_139012 [Chlorella variabilis]|eukprot:XP_005844303.1 hypothetical protein CHLNCDRAFT_139012 [Chlorella variabilis]